MAAYRSTLFHKLKISKVVNVILAALALHAAGVCAQAGYPAKPIQVVVPYPPGGSNDLFARAVGKRLAESLGQPVLIDNRAGAGSLNYATSGAGSINHFATELLKMAAGLNLTHVPYKGMGPAVNDLVGGHVDLIIASAPSVMSQVKAGKVTGIAVTSERRSPVAPDLPSLAESGLPGYSVKLWWGVLAPAGVPKDVVARLNAEINAGLARSLWRIDPYRDRPLAQGRQRRQHSI